MTAGDLWEVANLRVALDRWVQAETPPERMRSIVKRWAFNQHEDPYQGVVLAEGFEDQYSGEVPATTIGETAIMATYWIKARTSGAMGQFRKAEPAVRLIM